jgi:cation transport regulator ChaC
VPDTTDQQIIQLSITVLGRTLEHLGVQMYKRRDTAIAELVANCWDAGATRVDIRIPEAHDYEPSQSAITITDDGTGMTAKQVQEEYLVIGRNRRQDGASVGAKSRPVMGKKGIGKLAGFGLASQMEVSTWLNDHSTTFTLDIESLKREAGISADVPIKGLGAGKPGWARSDAGTRLVLRTLKHKTALDGDKLSEALARRFSRKTRGEMKIFVNGVEVGEPVLEVEARFPEDGYTTEKLPDGSEVRYYYAFSKGTIKSAELRGFTIYVRGKTAQAPPFFFHVEGTASGQHSTKYVTGAIEADFLDDGQDDQSDVISTDRQEIDWESERAKPLHDWGDQFARRVLRECTERKGKNMKDWILQNPPIALRVKKLDPTSQRQVTKFLLILGEAEPEQERALELADSLVRAFEYRHFHDVISDLDAAANDPAGLAKFLDNMREWKVLESRAVLEIVKGRLGIIEKFHQMIVNNVPETKSKNVRDNMHDLIAGSPWLLNPEWQVLSEEKTLSKQLAEWGAEEIKDEDALMRYDFLALTDERRLVIIEIKRSGHAVTLDDLQRFERYKEKLSKAHPKEIYMVMLCGGTVDVSDSYKQMWADRNDGEIAPWSRVYDKVRQYYEHYRAILEGDVSHADFAKKETEVAQTRQILESGTVHREQAARKEGLGHQDSDYRIGILAFGSLLKDLGSELTPLVEGRIENVLTPFNVEFARKSVTRDGAPTLAAVDNGGAAVTGVVFRLKPGVALDEARNMLWRRETDNIGTDASYVSEKPGDVEIRSAENLAGVGTVLYAWPRVNLSADATQLAELAIASARAKAGDNLRDGINYLMNLKEIGIKTPLMDEYEKAILEATRQSDLKASFLHVRQVQEKSAV